MGSNQSLKALALAAAAGAAGFSSAATYLGETTITLFTRSVKVKSFNVRNDQGVGLNQDAEGLAFYGGKLYVSIDHNSTQGDGKLGVYETNDAGKLGAVSVLTIGTRPDVAGRRWGPEGVTFSTSGKAYGAFLPRQDSILVTTESEGDDAALLVNARTARSAGKQP